MFRFVSAVIDAGADEDAAPLTARGALESVRAFDVAFGVISYHVDGPQRAPGASLQGFPVLYESRLGEGEGLLGGFPEDLRAQPGAISEAAAEGVEDAYEGCLETALAEAREVVRRGPEEVRVGEVDFRLALLLVAAVR